MREATDYIYQYETEHPSVSGTRELISFTEWLIKEVKKDIDAVAKKNVGDKDG